MHSCRPTSVWTGCLQGLSTALSRNTDTSSPELQTLGYVYMWVFIKNYYMAVLPPWKRFLHSTRLSEYHTVPLISALAIEAKTQEESLQCSEQFCIWIVLKSRMVALKANIHSWFLCELFNKLCCVEALNVCVHECKSYFRKHLIFHKNHLIVLCSLQAHTWLTAFTTKYVWPMHSIFR